MIDFGIGSPDCRRRRPIVAAGAEARETRTTATPRRPGSSRGARGAGGLVRASPRGVIDAAPRGSSPGAPATPSPTCPGCSSARRRRAGARALLPDPRYAVRFSGAVPARPIDADNDPVDAVARAMASSLARGRPRSRRRLLLLSFPHNPTTRCVEPTIRRVSSPSPAPASSHRPRLRLRRHRLRRLPATQHPAGAPAPPMSPSSSSLCRRATTWPAGGWASWPETPSHRRPAAPQELLDYGVTRPSS